MSRWRSVWPPPAAAIWLPWWFMRVSVRSLAACPRTRGGGGRAAGPEDGHGTPSSASDPREAPPRCSCAEPQFRSRTASHKGLFHSVWMTFSFFPSQPRKEVTLIENILCNSHCRKRFECLDCNVPVFAATPRFIALSFLTLRRCRVCF